MIHPVQVTPNPSTNQSDNDICKAIAFTISEHYFALPVLAISKVVRLDQTVDTMIERDGFILLDNHPLTVVDVRSRLFQRYSLPSLPSQSSDRNDEPPSSLPVSSLALPSEPYSISSSDVLLTSSSGISPSPIPCLIVVRSTTHKIWALRVDAVPELIELSLPSIYPVSDTCSQSIKNIAQYMAIFSVSDSDNSKNKTIFLMDLALVDG